MSRKRRLLLFIYLEFVDVSKHIVNSAVNGIDQLQTEFDPVGFMVGPQRSTAS